MTYIKVIWKHSFPDEPVFLYSELDDARREVRKVEAFVDGKMGYAATGKEYGGTILGKEPVPSLTEIAADSQFIPAESTEAEFDAIWAKALA